MVANTAADFNLRIVVELSLSQLHYPQGLGVCSRLFTHTYTSRSVSDAIIFKAMQMSYSCMRSLHSDSHETTGTPPHPSPQPHPFKDLSSGQLKSRGWGRSSILYYNVVNQYWSSAATEVFFTAGDDPVAADRVLGCAVRPRGQRKELHSLPDTPSQQADIGKAIQFMQGKCVHVREHEPDTVGRIGGRLCLNVLTKNTYLLIHCRVHAKKHVSMHLSWSIKKKKNPQLSAIQSSTYNAGKEVSDHGIFPIQRINYNAISHCNWYIKYYTNSYCDIML